MDPVFSKQYGIIVKPFENVPGLNFDDQLKSDSRVVFYLWEFGCEISLQDLINLKFLNHKLCYLSILKRCLINFNGSFLSKSPK